MSSYDHRASPFKNQVPVMEAYDQTQFIQGRNHAIKNIRSEAGEINKIASDINANIYEQDDKLDSLNREFVQANSEMRKANKDLVKASNDTKSMCKKVTILVSIIAVLLLVVVGCIFFFVGGF